MCGRYVSVARMAELIEQYKATGAGDDTQLEPSYNVAPTNKVHAVLEPGRQDGAGAVREVRAMRWGLVPAWWKPGTDPKPARRRPCRRCCPSAIHAVSRVKSVPDRLLPGRWYGPP